jgi:hypothetical protein
MNQEQAGQDLPLPDRLPQRVGEGMTVYDREGEVVGTVQVVYFGGASETAVKRELQEAAMSEKGQRAGNAFDADNVPEELRARLMRQGYIRLNSPELTGVKRYVLPEQIEGVFTEEIEGVISEIVRLRMTRNELLNT